MFISFLSFMKASETEIINDSNCRQEQRTQKDTKKTIVQLTQGEPLDKNMDKAL